MNTLDDQLHGLAKSDRDELVYIRIVCRVSRRFGLVSLRWNRTHVTCMDLLFGATRWDDVFLVCGKVSYDMAVVERRSRQT